MDLSLRGRLHRGRGGNVLGPSSAACAEGLLIPDLDTFQVPPWDTEIGRVFCDHFHDHDDPERPARWPRGTPGRT